MKLFSFTTILVAFLASSQFASAQAPSARPASGAQVKILDAQAKYKIQQEIDYVGSLFDSAYGPKEWKESHLNWDLKSQIALAQTKLAAGSSLYEARQAMADLISSTQDYHVSFSFYTTEKAVIPFQVKTVEGKSIIVFIDRTKLSEASFPFSVGDELVLMDRMPVAQVQQSLISKLGANIAGTDLALSDLYVTRRSARINALVPQGPVTLAIKKASTGRVNEITLNWEYTPEQFFSLRNRPKTISNGLLDKKMISNRALEIAGAPVAENLFGIGVRKSFLPDFGKRVWSTTSDNTFDAYIYQNEEGKKIGVIRIFGYIVDDYKKAISDFSGIIETFEKETDSLLIDQNNNPGGSVFYLYALVSHLSENAIQVPPHRVSLRNSEAKECIDTLEILKYVTNDQTAAAVLGDLSGYPATYQVALGIKDYCTNYLAQFRAGDRLSSPLHLWGVDRVTPNPVQYSKPIVVLINELDFSGGDFFPATLQDNKRATIVGMRTAGAGGYVVEANFPNNVGLESLSFTGSIAVRSNGQPIENLGVTPDVRLPMTVNDLRNGFKDYMDGVRTVLKDVMK